jgi:hypothetical protein
MPFGEDEMIVIWVLGIVEVIAQMADHQHSHQVRR